MKKYIIGIGLIVGSIIEGANQFTSLSHCQTSPLTFVKLSKRNSHSSKGARSYNVYALDVSTSFTSTYDSSKLAAFFSPVDKDVLVVKENMDPNVNPFVNQGAQDILSYNFNVVTQQGIFESHLTFAPIKKVWSSNLSFSIETEGQWWIQGVIPFRHMKTDMRLQEDIIEDSGGGANDLTAFNIGGTTQFANMKEAFAAKEMKYGKINGAQSATGFSDIVLRMGKEYTGTLEKNYIRPFMGMVIPCSNKPTAEYMFEPVLGNARRFGILMGSEFVHHIDVHAPYDVLFNGVMQVTYLVGNRQIRSFDIAGKPWGRYLAMFANDTDRVNLQYSFGINLCTLRVKIQPEMQFVYNSSLVVKGEEAFFKFGYQTNVRGSQGIVSPDSWSQPAIASIVQPQAQTNPARGINNLLDGFKDTSYRGIQKNELNLTNARHPFYIAHQVMMAYGREKKHDDKIYTIESGASITFGTTNAVPRELTVSLSLGCSL